MIRSTINFIITLVLAIIFSLVMPWWSVMLAAGLSGFIIPLKKGAVFTIPFLAIFCYWTIYCFVLSNSNNFILAKKIALLFPLDSNPYALIIITGIIGGISAGVSALLGRQIHDIIKGD